MLAAKHCRACHGIDGMHTCDLAFVNDPHSPRESSARVDPKQSPDKASITIKIKGALARAAVEIAGELEARDDVFEQMTDAEVARKLLAFAVNEHRAGRGPWPKTR